eukprot:7487948-Pyramimonas_sp.AAC.1
MALEATRELFGHAARVTDMTMVFPFVVPYRTSGAEPPATMRFVLRGDKNFEIQSTSATGATTTHAEGGIDLKEGPNDEVRSKPVDLEEARNRITEVVPVADVYSAIDGVGLWLGPMFQ